MLSDVPCASRTDYDKASGTHLACLNKSWRDGCRAHPRAFWNREATAELLRLVDKREEPEPTVAAIEATLGRGADPNTALEVVKGSGVTLRIPALMLLARSYDRADCVRHCFSAPLLTRKPKLVGFPATYLLT